MTITEKLLARAAGLDCCKPGDFVTCKLDLVLANDITAPIAIDQFREIAARGQFDVHGAEPRPQQPAEHQVVGADHGDVLGDAHAFVLESAH